MSPRSTDRPPQGDSPPPPRPEVLRVLGLAGVDAGATPRLLREAEAMLHAAVTDPVTAAARCMQARLRAESAEREGLRATDAALQLEAVLKTMLDAPSILARFEGLSGEGASARAHCRIGAQHQALAIHPSVSLEELGGLAPWEWVRVHPKELVVTGVLRGEELRGLALGELVEMRAWHDRAHGLVRVVRRDHEETVVALAPALRGVDLEPHTKLVLQRDDERWAIDALPADAARSRFEVPIDRISTRFEDLAGLDAIVEPLLEEILLGFVHGEERERFDLRPLRGILLWSYHPGMGKTALARALARWLDDLGQEIGFDVVLYVVKPNELKSVWHGGDAKLVREDLCGAIAARQRLPRTRRLYQIVVLDEIDALGRRAGGEDGSALLSSSQNDAVQALLAEMDGMVQPRTDGEDGQPAAHVLWMGLTNRPELVDEALKRPGRFGDLVLPMPAIGAEGAEAILALYARRQSLPWCLDGEIRTALPPEEIRARFLRPALAAVFDAVVLRYTPEGRAPVAVRGREVLAGVHYMEAMNGAKKRAASRSLLSAGVPAIRVDDVIEELLAQACSAARQLDADRRMLRRLLRVEGRVTHVDVVSDDELAAHRFVAPAAATGARS